MKYGLISFASLLLLSSCSWYKELERSLVEDDEKQMKRSSRPVTRAQYDQLLLKYEELSKKYELLKENSSGEKGSVLDDLQKSQSENFAGSNTDSETVNLFSDSVTLVDKSNISLPPDIESQLALYRKGISLKESNSSEATKIFQQLELNAISPVKSRARFQLGEMLLEKGQYDLALQVFEDIISKNADSGVIISALKGAVVASSKLGINNKKDQYSSMLNDVFESSPGM